jgi:hypothetical protein
MRAYLAVAGGIESPEYLGSAFDIHARKIRRTVRTGICCPEMSSG